MENVKTAIKDGKLTIEIDLNVNLGLTKTEKSVVIAKSGGFVTLPGGPCVNLLVCKTFPKEVRKEIAGARAEIVKLRKDADEVSKEADRTARESKKIKNNPLLSAIIDNGGISYSKRGTDGKIPLQEEMGIVNRRAPYLFRKTGPKLDIMADMLKESGFQVETGPDLLVAIAKELTARDGHDEEPTHLLNEIENEIDKLEMRVQDRTAALMAA